MKVDAIQIICNKYAHVIILDGYAVWLMYLFLRKDPSYPAFKYFKRNVAFQKYISLGLNISLMSKCKANIWNNVSKVLKNQLTLNLIKISSFTRNVSVEFDKNSKFWTFLRGGQKRSLGNPDDTWRRWIKTKWFKCRKSQIRKNLLRLTYFLHSFKKR